MKNASWQIPGAYCCLSYLWGIFPRDRQDNDCQSLRNISTLRTINYFRIPIAFPLIDSRSSGAGPRRRTQSDFLDHILNASFHSVIIFIHELEFYTPVLKILDLLLAVATLENPKRKSAALSVVPLNQSSMMSIDVGKWHSQLQTPCVKFQVCCDLRLHSETNR